MFRNACTCAWCASLVSRLLGHTEKRCVCDSDIADHFSSTLTVHCTSVGAYLYSDNEDCLMRVQRQTESCVCVCVRACVRACVRECVRACVRACVRVCFRTVIVYNL